MNAKTPARRGIVAFAATLFVGVVASPSAVSGQDAIAPAEPPRTLRAPEPDATPSAPATPAVSWETIAATMQSAQTLLAAGDAGSTTQRRQREALAHLDALIAAAAANAAAQSPAAQSPDSRNPAGTNDPATSSGNATGTDGQKANPNAVESIERHGEVKVEAPEATGPRRTAAEEFWGRLPQHVRQRVLQSTQTAAIPKYRAAVEEYFRRLLENDPQRTE